MKHFAAITWLLSIVALFAAAPTSDAGLISQSGARHYVAAAAGSQEWADVYVTDVATIGSALMTNGQKVGVEVGSTTSLLSVQVSAGNGGAIEIVPNGSFDGAENAVRMIPPTTILGGSGNAEHVSWLRFLDLWNNATHDIAQMNFRVLVYYGPRYYDLAPTAKSWGILATDVLGGGGNTQRSGVFDNYSPVSFTDWRYPFVTVETFSIYCNPYNSSFFFLEDCPASQHLIEIRSSAPSHSASPPQTVGEWVCFEHVFDTRQDRGNADGLVKLLVWTRDGLVSAREISGPLTHGNNWNFARRYISQFEGLGFYFNDAGTAHADNYVLYSHATFAANMSNTDTLIGPPPGFLLNFFAPLLIVGRRMRRKSLGWWKRVLTAASLFSFVVVAHAQVAYDNANSAVGTGTTASVSITVAANSLAIVGVQMNGSPTVSNPTFDSNAMTLIAQNGDLYMYRYHGHASGSRTASVTRSTSGLWAIGVVSVTGFDTGDPVGTHQTGTSNETTSVDTAAITSGSADWLLVDVALLVRDVIAAAGGQTERVSQESFNSGQLSFGMSSKPGSASTTTMSWTADATFGDNFIVGVPIRPAAGGGASAVPKIIQQLEH